MSKKLLLIDYENFRMSWIYKVAMDMKQYKIDTDDDKVQDYYIKLFLDKVTKYKNKFKSDVVVICKDAKRKNVWRKELLPSYKENRVYKQNGPMNEAFKVLNVPEVADKLTSIMEALGFKILFDENLEADDFMYLTCKQYSKDNEITLISTDADLIQLQALSPNVKQYNIQKEQYLKSLDPKLSLLEKIITGDAGDNIPNIGSLRVFNKNYMAWLRENKLKEEYTDQELIDHLFEMEDTNISKFVDYAEEYKVLHEKQIYGNKSLLRMGPKTADKIIKLGAEDWIEEKSNEIGDWLMDRYELNTTLVDLSKIPNVYQERYIDLDLLTSSKLSSRKMFMVKKKYGIDLS